MIISILFIDNRTFHNDILLQFARQPFIFDSYFLALDSCTEPEREDAAKVRLVHRKLVTQWLDALKSLQDDDTVYLPYDFSDQYTGWLRCTLTDGVVTIVRGTSTIAGWSFAPSDVGAYLVCLPDFIEVGRSVEVSHEEIVDDVASILHSCTWLGKSVLHLSARVEHATFNDLAA